MSTKALIIKETRTRLCLHQVDVLFIETHHFLSMFKSLITNQYKYGKDYFITEKHQAYFYQIIQVHD